MRMASYRAFARRVRRQLRSGPGSRWQGDRLFLGVSLLALPESAFAPEVFSVSMPRAPIAPTFSFSASPKDVVVCENSTSWRIADRVGHHPGPPW